MTKRIVYISPFPAKDELHVRDSGVAPYTKNLVSHLPDPGDELFVLCNKRQGYQTYQEDNITIIRCYDRSVRFVVQLWRELYRLQPHTVHIQQELGLFGGILTAFLLSWFVLVIRKYNPVITIHGVVSLKRVNQDFVAQNFSSVPPFLVRIALFIIFKPLCNFARKVIVHEPTFKHMLVDEYGVANNKIAVIPLGIEPNEPLDKLEARAALNIKPDADAVLFMGYLTGYKGLELLIDAFAEYAVLNPRAILLVGAGEHPRLKENEMYMGEYHRLKDKAYSVIPDGQVRWVGFIEDQELALYFSATDVSVYPYTISIASSGPMALAISYGQPFLASVEFKGVLPDNVLFERETGSLCAALETFFSGGKDHSLVEKIREERSWTIIAQRNYAMYEV